MRARLPISRGSLHLRWAYPDILAAFASPWIALAARDPNFVLGEKIEIAAVYAALSFFCALAAFLAFRLRDGLMHYFSVHDALDIAKAVLTTIVMTVACLFAFTRLESIPRSTPFIHALVLGASLVLARLVTRLFETKRHLAERAAPAAVAKIEPEHVIVIGANRLSALYIKVLQEYARHSRQVIAVLDPRRKLAGRAIAGVPIVGQPQHLQSIIEEYAVHGVPANRVVVGGDETLLAQDELEIVRRICAEHDVRLDYLPESFGFSGSPEKSARPVRAEASAEVELPRVFAIKRVIDIAVSACAILILSPLILTTAAVVLLDVGSPVLFWQRRMGLNGRPFVVYKFRTLRPPFDQHGRPIPENRRLSLVGRSIRLMRLDELPQLLNVLVGDMSLIGPRPLLPVDQPSNSDLRLKVRPGITGWAQVNGGVLLDADEKGKLDEWYIRNVSLWLDFKIVLMTLAFVMGGEMKRNRRNSSGRPRAVGTNYNLIELDELSSSSANEQL